MNACGSSKANNAEEDWKGEDGLLLVRRKELEGVAGAKDPRLPVRCSLRDCPS